MGDNTTAQPLEAEIHELQEQLQQISSRKELIEWFKSTAAELEMNQHILDRQDKLLARIKMDGQASGSVEPRSSRFVDLLTEIRCVEYEIEAKSREDVSCSASWVLDVPDISGKRKSTEIRVKCGCSDLLSDEPFYYEIRCKDIPRPRSGRNHKEDYDMEEPKIYFSSDDTDDRIILDVLGLSAEEATDMFNILFDSTMEF
jgi:hypothetical protein